MPKRELLTKALLARGYVRDAAARTTKYYVFRPTAEARMLLKPNDHIMNHRVYAGKAGALRFSRDGTVTNSIPFSDRTIARLLEEGEQ